MVHKYHLSLGVGENSGGVCVHCLENGWVVWCTHLGTSVRFVIRQGDSGFRGMPGACSLAVVHLGFIDLCGEA